MTWPAVDALDRKTPIVFPIAALEQHGHHMPLFTDSMLLGEVVRRVHAHCGDSVLFAPLMWLGNSDHHIDYAGTLSAPPRVYLDMLHGLAENFLSYGFKRIVFLNGHGGNDVPARQAVFELRQKHRQRRDLLLLAATYWSCGKAATNADGYVQGEMQHACEWETSMMLRLDDGLVGEYRSAPTVEPGTPFVPSYRGWTTRDRSAIGHIGQPAAATVAKGEALFAKFADEVLSMLKRVVEWDGISWNG